MVVGPSISNHPFESPHGLLTIVDAVAFGRDRLPSVLWEYPIIGLKRVGIGEWAHLVPVFVLLDGIW